MHSSRNARRGGGALASAALLVSLGFAASAIAIEPTPGAGGPRVGAPIILAQAALPKATFTNEQARRGEEDFKKNCVDCHGEDLRGGLLGGPPLRGAMFNEHFVGSPASGLFLYMSTQMPPDSPGRFSDSAYVDIMAYVLQVNGFDTGTALPSKVEALDKLVLEK